MKTELDHIVDVLTESGANSDKIEMYTKLYKAAIELGFKVDDFDHIDDNVFATFII
jgi:hypothetical protein